ncbi:hypothetical protein I3842_03G201000 [Carya illinoinensis]|uniref:Uncharacterized protein n=1 Tax=Carya illinoinensis TaxID=32201 RepID=A0A922K130_CARIL|nr:hypothetical protein I3842_03G201000 [Carya illinoinensis]
MKNGISSTPATIDNFRPTLSPSRSSIFSSFLRIHLFSFFASLFLLEQGSKYYPINIMKLDLSYFHPIRKEQKVFSLWFATPPDSCNKNIKYIKMLETVLFMWFMWFCPFLYK